MVGVGTGLSGVGVGTGLSGAGVGGFHLKFRILGASGRCHRCQRLVEAGEAGDRVRIFDHSPENLSVVRRIAARD